MSTLNITLPETMRDFIEGQVADGGYGTASAYIGALVREAQNRKAKEKIEALLLEGLNSGPSTEMTAQDWEDIRREVHERHAKGGIEVVRVLHSARDMQSLFDKE
jgi:antitoxin ParD1/3/4